jgi:hypothetical protein
VLWPVLQQCVVVGSVGSSFRVQRRVCSRLCLSFDHLLLFSCVAATTTTAVAAALDIIPSLSFRSASSQWASPTRLPSHYIHYICHVCQMVVEVARESFSTIMQHVYSMSLLEALLACCLCVLLRWRLCIAILTANHALA